MVRCDVRRKKARLLESDQRGELIEEGGQLVMVGRLNQIEMIAIFLTWSINQFLTYICKKTLMNTIMCNWSLNSDVSRNISWYIISLILIFLRKLKYVCWGGGKYGENKNNKWWCLQISTNARKVGNDAPHPPKKSWSQWKEIIIKSVKRKKIV